MGPGGGVTVLRFDKFLKTFFSIQILIHEYSN